MSDIIQVKRGTAALAASNNIILADGEIGFETDTRKGKIGDGVTPYNTLLYAFTGSVPEGVATQITAATTKITPVDADYFGITDSASSYTLKKLSFSILKSTLKTYFNTFYATITHTQNASTISAGTFATGNFIFPVQELLLGLLYIGEVKQHLHEQEPYQVKISLL